MTLAAAFGCPFEGPVDPGVVSDHVARMAAAGADEIMLADSIGVGVPAQVRRLVPDALAQAGGRPVGLHLHNTRNNGYANALAGLEHGVTILDASIGGLGGCPFAPGPPATSRPRTSCICSTERASTPGSTWTV